MSEAGSSRAWGWFGWRRVPGDFDKAVRNRRRVAPQHPAKPVPLSVPYRESTAALVPGPRLMPAASWAYQLQHIEIAKVAASAADVVVVDSSPDGDWRNAFTPEQVAAMKARPSGGLRKLISYMSIGEAEEQRFYWQKDWVRNSHRSDRAPRWLYSLNDQGWTGNWKVRFWDPAWQEIIVGKDGCFLDRIIDQGFDGVYLDIIDGYDFWLQPERGSARRPTAAEEMVAFVRRIAEHARVKRGKIDFAVVPQNGEGLLLFPQYRAAISAIGKEDIFFDQHGKADEKPHVKARPDGGDGVESILQHLRLALVDRIPILAVEYLRDWPQDEAKIQPTLRRMRENGFIPHFGRRDLGSLSETTLPDTTLTS